MSPTTLQHPKTHDDVLSASLATLVLQNTIEKFDEGKAQLLERLNQHPHGINAAVAKISNLLLVPGGNSGRSATLEDLDSVFRTIGDIILSNGYDVALCKTYLAKSTDDKTETKDKATRSGDSSGTLTTVVIPAKGPRLVKLYRLLHSGYRQGLDVTRTLSKDVKGLEKAMNTLVLEARTLKDHLRRGTILRGKFTGALNRLSLHYEFCYSIGASIPDLKTMTVDMKESGLSQKEKSRLYGVQIVDLVDILAEVVVRDPVFTQWKLYLVTDLISALSELLYEYKDPEMNGAIIQTLSLARDPRLEAVTKKTIPKGEVFVVDQEPAPSEQERKDRIGKGWFLRRPYRYLFCEE